MRKKKTKVPWYWPYHYDNRFLAAAWITSLAVMVVTMALGLGSWFNVSAIVALLLTAATHMHEYLLGSYKK